MYNFLIIIGTICVAWGVYLRNKEREKILPSLKESDYYSDKFEEILERIELIEEELKWNSIENSDDSTEFIDVFESIRPKDIDTDEDKHEIADDMLEAFKVISLYEEGKYSLEQVCKILKMRKGEVLFLRNLYIKYQE